MENYLVFNLSVLQKFLVFNFKFFLNFLISLQFSTIFNFKFLIYFIAYGIFKYGKQIKKRNKKLKNKFLVFLVFSYLWQL